MLLNINQSTGIKQGVFSIFSTLVQAVKDLKMNFCRISFLLVLIAAMCSAHIGGQAPNQELTQVYCGRTLANALALLCFKGSNKRSDAGMYNAALSPYYKEQEINMDWPWMVPYKARGMSGQRGKRQLVVSECCEKACSIDELLTYC